MHTLLYGAIISGFCSLLVMLALFSLESEKQVAARRLVEMTRERASSTRGENALGATALQSDAALKNMFSRSRKRSRFAPLVGLIDRIPIGFMRDAALPARLASAGYRDPGAPSLYVLIRIATPLAGLIAATFIAFHREFFLFALPAICYVVPDVVLRRLIHRRREAISISLPDAIDLMVICVEAGLGLDQALYRVSQELTISHRELTEELIILNLEQRAGKPRIQAWNAMAARLEVPEINAFLNMLTQTERFGTPIGRALSQFAESLRERRRQAAEEKAAKTNVKIIVPLTLFMFPSIFVILLGPAVLTLMRNLPLIGH